MSSSADSCHFRATSRARSKTQPSAALHETCCPSSFTTSAGNGISYPIKVILGFMPIVEWTALLMTYWASLR